MLLFMNETFTTELPIEAKAPSFTPEFFRLPRTGERDPFFGNSRSQYYAMEKAGEIRLVHVRPKGKTKGIVFVPYDQVAARIREAQQNGGDK
jgi:hypothetical protein